MVEILRADQCTIEKVYDNYCTFHRKCLLSGHTSVIFGKECLKEDFNEYDRHMIKVGLKFFLYQYRATSKIGQVITYQQLSLYNLNHDSWNLKDIECVSKAINKAYGF